MRVWPFLIVALPLVAVAAPRTKGKVVRVERARVASAIPRICDVRNEDGGICFGPKPEVGDIVSVLTETRVIAEVRVTETQDYLPRGGAGGACPGLHAIKVELLRGAFDPDSQTVGVVDRDLDIRTARKLPRSRHPESPNRRPEESVQIAIDRQNDGVADILVVQSDCDGQGQLCLDEWARVDKKMVRVQQTNFTNCGF